MNKKIIICKWCLRIYEGQWDKWLVPPFDCVNTGQEWRLCPDCKKEIRSYKIKKIMGFLVKPLRVLTKTACVVLLYLLALFLFKLVALH